MIRFNPLNKPQLTIQEIFEPIISIKTLEEAKLYFDSYKSYLKTLVPEKTDSELDAIINSNFGYYAGYYSNEVRELVFNLFGIVHPIFGFETNMTPEEAFQCGLQGKTLDQIRNTETNGAIRLRFSNLDEGF